MKIYDTIPAILADVNTGRLKAGFADKPILAYNVKQGLFPEVRLVNVLKSRPSSARSASACARATANCSRRSTPRSTS